MVLTMMQILSVSTAIRSDAGKLVRSPPTPNAARRCALTGASQKISHLKVGCAIQPLTVSHHHTQSSPKSRSPYADRHITEKKQKNTENLKKHPVRRTPPASSTPPPLSSDLPFHDRTSQVKGKQRIRLSAL